MAERVPVLPPSTPKNEPVPWPRSQEADLTEVQLCAPDVTGSSTQIGVDGLNRKPPSDAPKSFPDVKRAYGELHREVSRVLSRVSRGFRHLARERPMQIVAGVLVGSFLAGAALRIWRSNHD